MKKLLHTLKSNEFALFLSIVSVLVQSFHSYTAFYNMSSLKGTVWGIAQAVLFAFVIDCAILFYTLRNKKDVVFFASVFLFVINGYYYYSFWGFGYELIFAAFLSLLVPVTQYFYSEEIVDISDVEYESEEETQLRKMLLDKEIKIKDLWNDRSNAREEALGLRGQLEEGLQKNKQLSDSYYEAVEQRDRLRNSNTVLSEAVGRHLAENHELKKRLGDIPADAPLDINAAAIQLEEEISDRSLLNVQDAEEPRKGTGAYNVTRSDGPVV